MNLKDFWYIAAESKDLPRNKVMAVRLFDEWLALFRDAEGKAVALEDRCLHRCAPLSKGRVSQGELQCAYHGWVYDGRGAVVHVPSAGGRQRQEAGKSSPRQARRFQVCESDDYVYVRLLDARDEKTTATQQAIEEDTEPFRIPFYRAAGWAAIRLQNRFHSTVTNCVENFVDIPHTAFVHPKIFRVSRNEMLTASVHRKAGSVVVDYCGERANFGIFSRFLNRSGREIQHTDAFFMPNVTSVDYIFNDNRRFIITSQAIPRGEEETLVYTDLTYNYGIWNSLARPLIRKAAQRIIDQDIDILGNQTQVIERFGKRFSNTEADVIHVWIESIREALARGEDPRHMPEKRKEIKFWV
jgi:phenylpropionate dioxygenase-like ring-hydroxylating dioxygenase large terminal subunit